MGACGTNDLTRPNDWELVSATGMAFTSPAEVMAQVGCTPLVGQPDTNTVAIQTLNHALLRFDCGNTNRDSVNIALGTVLRAFHTGTFPPSMQGEGDGGPPELDPGEGPGYWQWWLVGSELIGCTYLELTWYVGSITPGNPYSTPPEMATRHVTAHHVYYPTDECYWNEEWEVVWVPLPTNPEDPDDPEHGPYVPPPPPPPPLVLTACEEVADSTSPFEVYLPSGESAFNAGIDTSLSPAFSCIGSGARACMANNPGIYVGSWRIQLPTGDALPIRHTSIASTPPMVISELVGPVETWHNKIWNDTVPKYADWTGYAWTRVGGPGLRTLVDSAIVQATGEYEGAWYKLTSNRYVSAVLNRAGIRLTKEQLTSIGFAPGICMCGACPLSVAGEFGYGSQ